MFSVKLNATQRSSRFLGLEKLLIIRLKSSLTIKWPLPEMYGPFIIDLTCIYFTYLNRFVKIENTPFCHSGPAFFTG